MDICILFGPHYIQYTLCTIVWVYHSLFSQFPINGLWASFQSFAVTNNVSINNFHFKLFCMCTDISPEKILTWDCRCQE